MPKPRPYVVTLEDRMGNRSNVIVLAQNPSYAAKQINQRAYEVVAVSRSSQDPSGGSDGNG